VRVKCAALAIVLGVLVISGQAQESGESSPVPERFVSAYVKERPKQFLVDPQQLIHPSDSKEHLEFLNYHSSDSAIDLYVYVFTGQQEIGGAIQAEDVVARVFATGKPAVVVHYFMGRPDRSALYLCPALAEVVSQSEQSRALETAVEQATHDGSPAKQLEKFMIQMSIRIYWMERLLQVGVMTESEPQVLEIAPLHGKAVEGEALSRKDQILAMVKPYAVPTASVLGVLMLAWLVRLRIKQRAQYRFPDLGVEERLGGKHAAGIGAVISFASAASPPAAQRDLRRGI
jgi:hypothetical protein